MSIINRCKQIDQKFYPELLKAIKSESYQNNIKNFSLTTEFSDNTQLNVHLTEYEPLIKYLENFIREKKLKRIT